jgi:hypothetical protein
MTDATTTARADGAEFHRRICVLGLAHAHRHALRPASLSGSTFHAPARTLAAESII